VDIKNGNCGSIRIVGLLVLNNPLDRNLFTLAGIDHVPREHDDISPSVASCVHLKRVRNAEGGRFSGAEFASSVAPCPAVEVLAMHLEEMVEIRKRHTLAVVGNLDAVASGKNRHLNTRRDTRINVL